MPVNGVAGFGDCSLDINHRNLTCDTLPTEPSSVVREIKRRYDWLAIQPDEEANERLATPVVSREVRERWAPRPTEVNEVGFENPYGAQLNRTNRRAIRRSKREHTRQVPTGSTVVMSPSQHLTMLLGALPRSLLGEAEGDNVFYIPFQNPQSRIPKCL